MTDYLRPVETIDHEWLVALHNDPEVLRNLTHSQPITMEHHLCWWERVSHDPRERRYVYVRDDHRVGFTKFYDIDHANGNCTLGADIHKEHRGKGYAKRMWTLMLHECFEQMKLHRVALTTASFNTIGRRVYAGLGFKEEGRHIEALCRDGVYHDMIDMYMLQSDWMAR